MKNSRVKLSTNVAARLTLALSLLGACSDKVNDTLLVVTATLRDFSPGSDVDRIDIEAVPSRGASKQRSFPVSPSTTFPITLGFVPVGSPELDVQIVVTGHKGEALVVSQRASVALVPDQARQLAMVLERACGTTTGPTCNNESTCRAGACVAPTVFAADLLPYPTNGADAAAGKDGSVPFDGSVGGQDAAVPDADIPEPAPGTWTSDEVKVTGLNAGTFNVTSVAMIARNDILLVGYIGGLGVAVRGDGVTFDRVILPTGTPPLYGVWAGSAKNVWAVGAQGTILHSNSSGLGKVDSGTTEVLTSVHGFEPDDTWVVGTNSTVLHGSGQTWRRISSTEIQGNLTSIAGTAADDLWIVGSEGGVFRGGGDAWERINHGLTRNLLYSVWAVGAKDVWAVGDRVAMRWDGRSFSAAPMPLETALGVWGAASNDVWAVGRAMNAGSSIVRWNGRSWLPVSPAVSRSLQNVRGLSTDDVIAVGNMGAVVRFAPLR